MLIGREGRLRQSQSANDFERQLNIGTYTFGDGAFKLVLGDLPCDRILAEANGEDPPHTLAFYLPGSTVVLLCQRLS